jgi:hypothetical protein
VRRGYLSLKERFGIGLALFWAAVGPKKKPPTLEMVREWHAQTPRNAFYDAHTPGKPRKSDTTGRTPYKGDENG